MSSPQQPYGGGWPGDPNQPPSDPSQYNVPPPGSGASYDVGSPQGFEQAGYGQPDYSGQYNSGQYNQADYQQYGQPAEYNQPYSAPGYAPPSVPPYSGPGYTPGGPGGFGPGGPPPKQTNWLPWVLGGGGVAVVVIVVLVVVALAAGGGGGNPNPGANRSSGPAPSGSPSGGSSPAPAGGTYAAVDNLCDVLDTSAVDDLASEQESDPSDSSSNYSDYSYISCDVELTNNGTSDLNLVSVHGAATIYGSSSAASDAFDTEYQSAKGDSTYQFRDVSDIGEKAFSSFDDESTSSYSSIIQEVKVLDGNAEFDVQLIMTTTTSVNRDQSQDYATKIATALMSSLHN